MFKAFKRCIFVQAIMLKQKLEIMIYLSRFEKTNKDLTIQANMLYAEYLSNKKINNKELADKFLLAYKETIGLRK